jgi:glucose/mannose-6-phosphate isomerase
MQLSDLEEIDTKNMHKTYDQWPEIAEKSFLENVKKFESKDIDHIIFCGMGGSGSIGDILTAILSTTDIHVTNVKGYLLPKTVDGKTVVICISISGNTQETLSVLESTKKKSCKVLAFSSGGKIKEYSTNNNIPYYEIPQMHSPRASLPSFLYCIINVLQYFLPITKDGIIQSITNLKKTRDLINSKNLEEDNPSLNLAKWIDSSPIIYYPNGLQSVAIRFKNSLQENSKLHVIAEDAIEACHNGIVGWERKSKGQPILLQGIDDYTKTKERWEILKEYFIKSKIDFQEVYSIKGNILSKIINLIYILDYCSIYHAVLSKIDPSPVKSIDFIKERI